MQRILLLFTCISALLLSACSLESNFPTPTGKGAVRAINAIPGSPDVAFLIEERPLGVVSYQASSNPATYDDFDYSFNFDIRYPGELEFTRVASQEFKVEADRDHIFLLTGDINAPTITIWNGDRRTWSEGETVFEVRFSHAIASLSDVDIDVYLDEPGTVLGTNAPVATLSYGEIANPADFEQGEYVITVTDAGDLNAVRFTSNETDFLPRFAHVITVFDGDGNDTAPFVVRSMTSVGNELAFPDARYPRQTRFVHAAYTLETVDIYDDESLTNPIAADVAFKGSTEFLDSTGEAKIYYFTPAGSQATVLFQWAITAQPPGTFRDIYLIGDTDAWTANRVAADRASSVLNAKMGIVNSAFNQTVFDVYVKDRGDPLVEDDVRRTVVAYGFLGESIELPAGSFDIYLTEQGTKTEISAPYPVDVVLGDVIHVFAVDTVDPNIVELVDLPLL